MTKRVIHIERMPGKLEEFFGKVVGAVTGRGYNEGLDGRVSGEGADFSELNDGARIGVYAKRNGEVSERVYGNLVNGLARTYMKALESGEGLEIRIENIDVNPQKLDGSVWMKAHDQEINEDLRRTRELGPIGSLRRYSGDAA